jgi:hypothetical protein
VCSLVSMIGKGALMAVNFSSQEVPYELTDMEEIYKQLTLALGTLGVGEGMCVGVLKGEGVGGRDLVFGVGVG